MVPSSSSSEGGRLVSVAYVPSEMEAEMIQGLLTENGFRSVIKRELGLSMPEFPVGGCRVLVAEDVAELAREVLAGTPGSE